MGAFFTKAFILVMEHRIQTTRNLWTMTTMRVRGSRIRWTTVVRSRGRPELRLVDQLTNVGGGRGAHSKNPTTARRPYDPDVNTLVPELRERSADPQAIEYLRREIFPTGKISLLVLQAPMCSDEAQADEMTQK